MTTEIIHHDEAVIRIADHLADCDAFIILVQPDQVASMTARLDPLDAWTAYAIDAVGQIVVSDDRALLTCRDILAELVGVPSMTLFTVPKTVPAGVLGAAIGQRIPADGSQDVIICYQPDKPIAFPMVFVEALDQVDPKAAMALRATDLASLS